MTQSDVDPFKLKEKMETEDSPPRKLIINGIKKRKLDDEESTEDDLSDESWDEHAEDVFRSEVKDWLTTFGPTLFACAANKYLVKKEKAKKK